MATWSTVFDRKPLSIIVAMSRNRVIGAAGQLPWHLPEDLRHFKRTTLGHAVILGRRTFESVGRPLAGRRNIVVSRTPGLAIPGCEVASGLDEAIELARRTDPEPIVIGGGMLYRDALDLATRIYLTEVQRDVEGDTYFPAIDEKQWNEVSRTSGEGVVFRTLERK